MDTTNILNRVLTQDISMGGVSRVPFFFGSEMMIQQDILAATGVNQAKPDSTTGKITTKLNWDLLNKMIRLRINPNSLTLTPYVRITEVMTGSGRIYYHWLNDKDRATEAYTLALSGVTGNLLPNAPESSIKLYTWTRLRELTLEPYWWHKPVKIENISEGEGTTYTTTVSQKTRNRAFILIKTIAIPTIVLFVGFFRKPMTLVETAESPYNFTWDVEFVIEQMFPEYTTLSKYISGYLAPEIINRTFPPEIANTFNQLNPWS